MSPRRAWSARCVPSWEPSTAEATRSRRTSTGAAWLRWRYPFRTDLRNFSFAHTVAKAIPPLDARTVPAVLTLRHQVISPILAGIRGPKMGCKPVHWNRVDRNCEGIRIDMQTLLNELAIETPLTA